MGYKLLALDIDGTLVTSSNSISDYTKENILLAQAQGMIITLATGRNYVQVKSIAEQLDINLPIITNDGTYIIDTSNNKVLYEKRFDNQILLKLINILNESHLDYLVACDDYTINNNFNFFKMIIKDIGIKGLDFIWKEKSNFKIISGKKIIDHLNHNKIKPFKISVYGKNKTSLLAIRKIEKELPNQVKITTSGHDIEILPAGMSKAKGLEILSIKLAIDKSEIMAIGNDFNDLEMIQYVGLGIAMENAPSEVRKHARFVTKSNDNDGVAYAIDKYILNKNTLSC